MDRNKKYIILNYNHNIVEVVNMTKSNSIISFKDRNRTVRESYLEGHNNVTCVIDNKILTDNEYNHFKRLVNSPVHLLGEDNFKKYIKNEES